MTARLAGGPIIGASRGWDRYSCRASKKTLRHHHYSSLGGKADCRVDRYSCIHEAPSSPRVDTPLPVPCRKRMSAFRQYD